MVTRPGSVTVRRGTTRQRGGEERPACPRRVAMERSRDTVGPGKLARWLRRYLPAELAGTSAALAAAVLTLGAGSGIAAAAVAAAWAESAGFYAFVLARQLRARPGADARPS